MERVIVVYREMAGQMKDLALLQALLEFFLLPNGFYSCQLHFPADPAELCYFLF